MRRLIPLLGILMVGSLAAAALAGDEVAVGSLTLPEAWKRAKAFNESLALQREEVYKAATLRNKAAAVILPRLQADASWTAIQAESKSTYLIGGRDSSGTDGESGFSTIEYTDYYRTRAWGATLTQPLFQGQALPLYMQALANEDAQRRQEERSAQDLILNVTNAYLGVLQARGAKGVADRQVERLEAHRRLAEALLEVGRAIKTDRLQAELELASAHNQQRHAANQVDLAEERLYLAIGERGPWELQEPGKGLLPEMPALEEGLESARRERQDLQAAYHGVEAARQARNRVYATWLPTANFIGAFTHEENDAFLSRESDVWTAAFAVSLPLFEGGLQYANLKEENANLRQAQWRRQALERQISLEARQGWLNLQTARDIAESTQLEVELARERFRLVEERFQQGAGTGLDVKDAQTALAEAEFRRVNAEYDDLAAQFGWLHSIGLLSKLAE